MAHIVGGQLAVALAVLMGLNASVLIFHLQTARIRIPQPRVAVGREVAVAVVAPVVARGGEVYEAVLVGVVATVALALQSYEQQSVGILVQFAYAVVQQQSVVTLFLVPQHVERIAVMAAQSVARRHPDISMRVLHHIDDIVAGQPVFSAQVAIFQFCLPPHTGSHP